MPERRRQRIDLRLGEAVLAALGGAVHLLQRKARLVGEVALEQPMRADDLPRHALAVRRQLEFLAAGDDQVLVLHPRQQLHQPRVAETKGAAERVERREPAAILLVEEVFQRVFDPGAVPQRPPPPHPANRPHRRQQDDRCRRQERGRRHRQAPAASVPAVITLELGESMGIVRGSNL